MLFLKHGRTARLIVHERANIAILQSDKIFVNFHGRGADHKFAFFYGGVLFPLPINLHFSMGGVLFPRKFLGGLS